MASPKRLPVVATRSSVHEAPPNMPAAFVADGLPQLADAAGRVYDYLRFSVTDRCDLACVYCMPEGGEREHGTRPELLSFEEVARVVGLFARLGVRRVRFTGGEPLVRKDVVRLVELVSRTTHGLELVLTTNAMLLAELAAPLKAAGLAGVNVSLDSLNPEKFRRITRGGDLPTVRSGIRAALDAGLEVKLNTVVLGGENDDELAAIVDYAWDNGITPRFIELMPLGEGAMLPSRTFVSLDAVIGTLSDRVDAGAAKTGAPGRGPARYLPSRDGNGRRVGFITAMSETFCDACNRVRVTARGDIRACLASRRAVSLRDALRSGASDAELAWAVHWALASKDAGHHFLDDAAREHTFVGMSLIGG